MSELKKLIGYFAIGLVVTLALGTLGVQFRHSSKSGGSASRPAKNEVQTPPSSADHKRPSTPRAQEPQSTAVSSTASSSPRERIVPDDGKRLWVSPTSGAPLELNWLPIGTQVFVALRPAEILKHSEQEKILAALGPAWNQHFPELKRLVPAHLEDVEQLVIGVQVTSESVLQTSLVVHLSALQDAERLLARWGSPTKHMHGPAAYYVNQDRSYAFYLPQNPGRLIAIAPPDEMPGLIDLEGESLPLSPQMERLVADTDRARQFTLIVAPQYLFGDGAALVTGVLSPLARPLFFFVGDDELKAVSLSLHLEDDFFLELRLRGDLEVYPTQIAAKFQRRIAQLPDEVSAWLGQISPHPYAEEVLDRFPAMLRFLSEQTRAGTDGDSALLRAYLPGIAAHNLLLGCELALAQQAGGTANGMAQAAASPAENASDAQAMLKTLQKTTSLAFDRETLETALQMLATDLGLNIVILGGDLQLEGITKNQSFGLSARNETGQKILERILREANPDKTARGLSDPKQKLVYVIQPQKPDGEACVFVTTRAQAKKRGEKLPAVFLPSE